MDLISKLPTLLVSLLALCGGVYALLSFKKLQPAYRWIGIYLLAAGLIQILGSYILSSILRMSNTPLYNFAIFGYHFILFMAFYYLHERRISRTIMIYLFGVSTLIMAYLVATQVPSNFLSIKAVIVGLFVYSVCSMIYLIDFMVSTVAENPIRNSRFIALSGLLFYFSASGVYFAGHEIFEGLSENLFGFINLFLMAFFYIILTVAIYMNKNRDPEFENAKG